MLWTRTSLAWCASALLLMAGAAATGAEPGTEPVPGTEEGTDAGTTPSPETGAEAAPGAAAEPASGGEAEVQAPPAVQFPGYDLVVRQETRTVRVLHPATPTNLTATCKKEEVLVGGGFAGNVQVAVLASMPEGNGWHVRARFLGGEQAADVTAYALCAQLVVKSD